MDFEISGDISTSILLQSNMSDTISKIPLSANYAYGPFGVTIVSAIYLLTLPIFLVWRMKKRDRDFPVSANEKKVTYLLFVAVAAMQLSEVLKAAFFGLNAMYPGTNS